MAQVIAMLSGLAICCWCFWRINIAPGRGDWAFKLSALAIFAACSLCVIDALRGDRWDWDIPALMFSVATYLLAGMVRHHQAQSRPHRQAEEPTL